MASSPVSARSADQLSSSSRENGFVTIIAVRGVTAFRDGAR